MRQSLSGGPGRGQEQACKAIERTPQQGIRDERKQRRCKQELQRVDEPLGDELIDAVERDRDEEGGSYAHLGMPIYE